MQLLRPTRLLLALVVLAPAAAEAAPASKKPPPAPSASLGPAAPPRAPGKNGGALQSTSARGSTAHLSVAAAAQRPAPIVSRSVGSPTDGHLLGGAHLATTPYLRVYPVYADRDVRWGTDTLVGLIDRSARAVRKQFPDAVMSVGHLSKQGGGEIDRHASHESGRDADVGFYVKNASGKPLLADHMVPFVGDGTAPTWPGAHFDDARNWALVAAIVSDPHAKVTHLFVATPIRERLLAYAARSGASPVLRSKAAEVLAQPRGALPHDDHFHVRIACPGGADNKCIEIPLPHHGRAAAVASNGHPAHAPGHGASTPAPAAGHGSVHAGAPPPKPAAKAEASREEAKDSIIPSLAPEIPGLDSAVIPAPLSGAKPTWGTTREEPISDPDGVLEGN
ncbi:MAG: hypothetical protein JWP97_5847 [Labilithrix sp.]|nr:hypothetical protein [Labilithrix sp.]